MVGRLWVDTGHGNSQSVNWKTVRPHVAGMLPLTLPGALLGVYPTELCTHMYQQTCMTVVTVQLFPEAIY